MEQHKMTLEAVIGLVSIIIATVALIFTFTAPFVKESLIIEGVVNTKVASALTGVPTQTPFIITATFTPTLHPRILRIPY